MTAIDDSVARCTCGRVELALAGAPILVAACYCDDCQQAATQIEALPGAAPIMDFCGGTEYLLYRKDRVTRTKGGEQLLEHKLSPDSPTSRSVAACCNTAMFLDFQKGHWLSVHRARCEKNAPALQMRIQTRFAPAGCSIPGDVPVYSTYPVKFIAKVMAAKVAMLIGR